MFDTYRTHSPHRFTVSCFGPYRYTNTSWCVSFVFFLTFILEMKKNVVYTSDISCCCHANWQSSSIHSGKTQVIACTAKWAATCKTYIRITDDIKGKSNDYLRPLFFTYSKIQNLMLSDGLCHLLMATIVTGCLLSEAIRMLQLI